MKTISPVFLSLLIAATGASASESPRDTVNLNEVVVTAPLKTDPELIPLDVTVISEGQIEKSAESSLLPVLEAKVPGLFVTERGFEGYGVSGASAGSGQVYIRGVGDGGNKVLFMIDGQPQWAGIFGHSLSDTYVANGVERIEVIKGPSSLLYGSNAMGGSINLITKTQKKDGITGRARAMFGSFTTQKFSLSTGYKKGKFSATLGGQLDRSNGNRDRSSFWLANEFAQLKYAISGHWSIAGMLDMTQSFSNYPGSIQQPRENTWSDIFRGTGGIYVKNSYAKMDGGIQGYINWGSHKIDDGNLIDKEPPTDYLFNSDDYNMGFTIYESFYLWKMNTLSAGVDFQHWGGHMWNTDKVDPDIKSSEEKHHVNEIAGYVMMQQGFFNDILNINGGVRLQHGSSYGNVWVPQAGFIVKPGYNAQIKASFSKGFTSPNIRQLYLYPPKNPDLKPEYLLNYEISYSQQLLDYRLTLGAAIYFIDGRNMIQLGAVDGRRMWQNTGKFHNKGFELEASYSILSNLQASASWAYLHCDSDNLYSPKNKLNAEVTYSPGNFSFSIEEMSIWGMKYGNPDGSSIDYTLLNLRASYTYPAKVPVTLFVKIDNITDRHYEIIYGYPMPGATFMGGVEVKF